MKFLLKLFSITIILSIALISGAFAQNAGDFRTAQSGFWDDVATWEMYDGSSWVAASYTPTDADGIITILSGDTVEVVTDVTVDEVVVEGGLVVSSGAVLQLASDIATITGAGTFTLSAGAGLGITSPDGITASSASGNIQTGTRVFDSGASYLYNGTSPQVTGDGLPANIYELTIDNASGVTLSGNLTIDGTLDFLQGRLITGTNVVTIDSSGVVTNAGPGQYVYGNLKKVFLTGPQSFTFDIGASINYRPVTVSFANITTGGTLTARVGFGDHPNINTSMIDPDKDVNCRWNLTKSSELVSSLCDATFNFVSSDVDAGADPNNFIINRWDGSNWHSTTLGTRTATSTQALNLTWGGDFVLGELWRDTIIATAGPNGSITPSGIVSIIHGDNQTFSITPNTNYHVDSLFVDGVHVDSTTSYTFYNVTDNHTINATFAIDQFTITANASAGGTISPSGAVTVNYGSDQKFTITPNSGYHFVDLFVDSVHVDSTTSYTFYNVTTNHTIYAVFDIDKHIIMAGTSSGGSITPSGAVLVNHGSDQTFVITPDPGYHFVDLFVDSVHVDSTVSYTFYNVTTNHSIYAIFDINTYTITASASAGGTISPSGTVSVNHGGSQQFLIAANTGYHLDTLFVDGMHVDSTTSYTFYNVTSNHSIYAKFAINTYIITASAGPNGSISPSGNVVVNYGADQSFNFIPNSGYIVDSVFVDGSFVGSDTSYTFHNVTANHTIYVQFKLWEGIKNVEEIPTEYALRQNYPNPFNPSTLIQFDLPKQSTVTLKVYNLIGTEVVTIYDNQSFTAGYKEVTFDGANLASGIYFYRLVAVGSDGNTFTQVKRMMLIK